MNISERGEEEEEAKEMKLFPLVGCICAPRSWLLAEGSLLLAARCPSMCHHKRRRRRRRCCLKQHGQRRSTAQRTAVVAGVSFFHAATAKPAAAAAAAAAAGQFRSVMHARQSIGNSRCFICAPGRPATKRESWLLPLLLFCLRALLCLPL